MKYGLDMHLYSSFVEKVDLSVKDVFLLFSSVLDYFVPGVRAHHLAVAFISFEIAMQMGLDEDKIECLTDAALIHDIGLGGVGEGMIEDPDSIELDFHHCELGYKMLKKVPWADKYAEVIRHHHDTWDGRSGSGAKGDEIPIGSRIIFLADRVAAKSYAEDIASLLNIRHDVLDYVRSKSRTYFDPDVVGAFEKVAEREAFWFSLDPKVVGRLVRENVPVRSRFFSVLDVITAYTLLADIVDFKSQFTRNHSINVANLAALLATKANFSEFDTDMMMLGGLLHDIGKVAVPSYILDKPGRLTQQEFNIMKAHPYITHLVLQSVPKFGFVDMVASLHHERLNGTGYPFHLTKRHLSIGARIMAVADIFSALYEHRPYRRDFKFDEIIGVLMDMVTNGEIDMDIVDLIAKNRDEVMYLLRQDVLRKTIY